uniref:Metalloendopeptidase n=1 Tax=Strongyloides stercoralis TaxID=6248 RepID=A0AAF5D367_STRER
MKYLIATLFVSIALLVFGNNIKLNSYSIEKDSILSRKRRATYENGHGKFEEKPIKYKIDNDVNETLVKEAIKIVEEATCIRFKEDKQLNGSGLEFIESKDLYYADAIGKVSSIKPLKLGIAKEPVRVGFAVHEILHALGFFHEHQRSDREKYIEVNFDNIPEKYHSQFEMARLFQKETYGIKYDYGSMLHYEREAGHKEDTDSNITITTKNKHYLNSIGQRTDISFLDGKLIDRHYCSKNCENEPKLNCSYGGYPNPIKCNECKCPTFYDPPFCRFVKKSSKNCGKKIRKATRNVKTIEMKGIHDCYFIIRSKNSKVVEMTIKEANSELTPICQPGSEDKQLNGSGLEFIESKEHYYAESVGVSSENESFKIGIAKNPVRVRFAVHEILHALGLFHEHERKDREKYIEIKFDNIQEKYHGDFEMGNIFQQETYGVKYDFGSLLHYEREAGHKEDTGSNITITTKNKHYFLSIGQSTHPSFLDTKLFNNRYCYEKCKDKPKLNCSYGGYANPKKCDECKCPTFYEPPFCRFVKNSSPECGKKIRKATRNVKTIKMEGIHDCHYIIRAKENQTVEITIKKANSELTPICQPGSGLNIKFLKNKALSPVCFCGETTNYVLKSEGSEVVLRYIGKLANDSFELDYKSLKISE